MWKVLNKAIGSDNNSRQLPDTFNIDNKAVSNKSEIACAFNQFFADIGLSISSNVPSPVRNFDTYLPNRNAQSIFLSPVIPADILDITRKLKPKTSYGEDGISTKLLKMTIDLITVPFTHIANLIFQTGIFPNDLKRAKFIKQPIQVY